MRGYREAEQLCDDGAQRRRHPERVERRSFGDDGVDESAGRSTHSSARRRRIWCFATASGGATGRANIVAEGLGPEDGLAVPKIWWPSKMGDYGAAAVDVTGNLWFANEWIAQTCTFSEYLASPLGRCGGERSTFGELVDVHQPSFLRRALPTGTRWRGARNRAQTQINRAHRAGPAASARPTVSICCTPAREQPCLSRQKVAQLGKKGDIAEPAREISDGCGREVAASAAIISPPAGGACSPGLRQFRSRCAGVQDRRVRCISAHAASAGRQKN
ncbi:MAG: hypothetical protein JWN62_2912 [Acidimicrobiales bacterium]|nr:hypothetical protein [Acidimicrobiales bacterium]